VAAVSGGWEQGDYDSLAHAQLSLSVCDRQPGGHSHFRPRRQLHECHCDVGETGQLGYHASAHKNCTPAALPTIRVIEAPKSGTLTVRRAVLTTDKVAGCPGLKTPAQAVFYLAHAGYAGSDHVKYEVTTENGEGATYDVTITVKAAPAQSLPATGDRPL